MDVMTVPTSGLHIFLLFFKDDTELQYILIFDFLNIEVALKKDYPIVRQKSTLINTVKFSNLSV